MTNRLFVLALLGTSALALPAANAADIILPPVEYVEEVKDDYSGWYIRGDVGYTFSSETDGKYKLYQDAHFDWQPRYHYDELTFEDSYSVGAGVGYRWAEHFRTDASVDYYGLDVKGRSSCAAVLGNCYYDDKSDADVWTVMANAYVDLPYMGPVTPYFGAGIGFAHVSYGDLNNDIKDGFGNVTYSDVHEGEDSWRFATSLMAGASIDITKNLALDAGYRYTRVYEGDAWGYDTNDKAAGASGVQTEDNGFNIHAVRAGLRYSFF